MNSQKGAGAALITALFIMAIVAIAATAMALRLQIDIRRTDITITANNSYSLSQGVPTWAVGQLLDNQAKNRNDPMTQSFPVYNYENAKVSGSIQDMQSRFNLNNLSDPDDTKREAKITGLARLITIVAPKYEKQANSIARATAEWVSTRGKVFDANTTEFYKTVNPRYGVAYLPMLSISEFRLVAGVTPELFELMAPWIVALPEITKINLNTAPKEILLATFPEVQPSQADAFIKERENTPGGFTDLSKIMSLKVDGEVTSRYFLTTANIELNGITQQVFTLLLRDTPDKKAVTTIWESRGGV